MEQLCSRCKSELVEFYPEEEHFDLKEYTVYCDECQEALEDERVDHSYSRGNISDVHGHLFDCA